MSNTERIEWGICTPEGTVYPMAEPTDRDLLAPKVNGIECEWVTRRVRVGPWRRVWRREVEASTKAVQ